MRVFTPKELFAVNHGAKPWVTPPDRKGWVSNRDFMARCEELPPGETIWLPQADWDEVIRAADKASRIPVALGDETTDLGEGYICRPFASQENAVGFVDVRYLPLFIGLTTVRLWRPSVFGKNPLCCPIAGIDDDKGRVAVFVLPVLPAGEV